MAVKPESQFIALIHKRLPPSLHKEKMHNVYRGGTADCWYSGRGGDLWVEYKYEATLPKTRSVSADLSELQKDWLRKRYEEGRNVAVIIGCAGRGVVLRDLAWERTFNAEEFCYLLKSADEVADFIKGQTSHVGSQSPPSGASRKQRASSTV